MTWQQDGNESSITSCSQSGACSYCPCCAFERVVRDANLQFIRPASICLPCRHAAEQQCPWLDDNSLCCHDLSRARNPFDRAPRSALDMSSDTSLKSLAERDHIFPFKYVQRVQQSLAEIASIAPSSDEGTPSGRWNRFIDNVLSALLSFGYPALALILFLGALGLPLPNGLSAVIAGSLAAAGRMSWSAAILIAITSSVLGDMIAYGLGRFVGGRLLEHWGHWIGYTRDRQARMQVLLQRWGGILVLVTRTLVSSVSSVVGLIAGISHYRASHFLPSSCLAASFGPPHIWGSATALGEASNRQLVSWRP
jgi:membrane protein DedA with SNARE-associated domain